MFLNLVESYGSNENYRNCNSKILESEPHITDFLSLQVFGDSGYKVKTEPDIAGETTGGNKNEYGPN